jgi:outer membrane receptor for monomeric catechols
MNRYLEYRRDNQKWTIKRNWQHWVLETQYEDKQSKVKAQYVFDTTIRKQTQIT